MVIRNIFEDVNLQMRIQYITDIGIEVDERRCQMITRIMCILSSQMLLLSRALLTSYFK